MEKEQLEKIIDLLLKHDEGEGGYCDTGEDMEWGCRSECVELAIMRLREKYGNE